MNYFENEPVDLFGGEETIVQSTVGPSPSPQYVNEQATLQAFATTPKGTVTPEMIQYSMAQRQEALARAIKAEDDRAVRAQLARQQLAEETASTVNTIRGLRGTDPALAESITGIFAQGMQEQAAERHRTAVERATVDRIRDLAAQGDSVNADLLTRQLLEGGPEDLSRDRAIKHQILRREILKAEENRDRQNILFSAVDFVMQAVNPFDYGASHQGLVDIDKGLQSWYDWLFSGTRFNREAAALSHLPVDQYEKYLTEVVMPRVKEHSTLMGIENQAEVVELLRSLETPDTALTMNALAGVSLATGGVVGDAVAGGKLLMGLPEFMTLQGARKPAGALVQEFINVAESKGVAAAEEATGVTAEDALKVAVPSAINPDAGVVPPVLNEIELARQSAINFRNTYMPTVLQPGRTLSESELQDMFIRNRERVESMFGRDSIIDVRIETTEVATGQRIYSMDIELGTTAGSRFRTKKAANEFLAARGLEGEVVRDVTGGWKAVIRRPVVETVTSGIAPAERTWLGRLLLNSRLIGAEELHGPGIRGGAITGHFKKAMLNDVIPHFERLTRPELENVRAALTASNVKRKWFSESEFRVAVQKAAGRTATENEVKAYQAYREMNDIDYVMRNDEMYVQLYRAGNRSVSFGQYRNLVARVDRELADAGADRVFDIETGIHYTKNKNPLTKAALEDMKRAGKVIVHVRGDGIEVADKSIVRSFIVKATDVNETELAREVVGYNPGGHGMYDTKWFLKQTRTALQADGSKALLSPRAFATGTKAEMENLTKALEEARVLVKEHPNLVRMPSFVGTLDEVFAKYGVSPFESGESFLAKLENGEYQLEHAFETTFDRQNPEIYSQLGSFEKAFDEDAMSVEQLMHTQGRMYYSKRGEGLRDYTGAMATHIDPFEAMDRALNNISMTVGLADYRISAIEHWVASFKKYTQFANDPNVPPYKVFREGVITHGTPARHHAEGTRDVIRRNLSWRTEADHEAVESAARFQAFVEGSDPTSLRHGKAKALGRWWEDANPVRSLKEFAFDAGLGFFNAKQIFVQAAGAITAVMLSPAHAWKGFSSWRFLAHYLTKAGTDKSLATMIKRGAVKAAGFDTEAEFVSFMKYAKHSGLFDIDMNHAMMADYGPNVLGGPISRAYDKVKIAGRAPFMFGEKTNLSMAYRIAWEEAKEAHPEAFKSLLKGELDQPQDFLNFMARRMDDYTLNMREQSKATWQHGLLSIPTQFWTYNIRSLEVFLGKQFTWQQKLRLVTLQTILYGAAATPLLAPIAEFGTRRNAADKGLTSEEYLKTVGGAFDRGLLDEIIYHTVGADMNVGSRFAVGGWIPQMIEDIFGFSEYGDKSLAEWAGGASGGITGSILLDGFQMVKDHVVAEMGTDDYDLAQMDADNLRELLSNISSLSDISKAQFVFKYGTWMSNSGGTQTTGLPPTAGVIAVLMGGRPGQLNIASAQMRIRKEEAKVVKDAARVIMNYRTRMMNETDNRENIARQIQLYMSTLPPDIRAKALRQANRSLDPSLADGLTRQMLKRKQEQLMIEEASQ